MDKPALIKAYVEQSATLEKVEKALEITKTRRSTIVKQVFEAHGKGPHEVDGKWFTVVQKGDTYFFMPVKALNPDGTPKATGPSQDELDQLVKAIATPMAAADVAKAMGTTPGPKLSELIKVALEQGLIGKTGERAKTLYTPKPS